MNLSKTTKENLYIAIIIVLGLFIIIPLMYNFAYGEENTKTIIFIEKEANIRYGTQIFKNVKDIYLQIHLLYLPMNKIM